MTVYAIQNTFLGPRVAGVQVYTGLENDGTLNLYAQFSSDLISFQPSTPLGSVDFWKLTYFMEGQLAVDNFENFSKLEGFPDRYRLGSYRYLSGNRPQSLRLIDTLTFSEDIRHTSWLITGVSPTRPFLTESPTELDSYDAFFPLSWMQGAEPTTAARIQAELFAFSVFRGVTMDLNLQYTAQFISIEPFEGTVQSVFLPVV